MDTKRVLEELETMELQLLEAIWNLERAVEVQLGFTKGIREDVASLRDILSRESGFLDLHGSYHNNKPDRDTDSADS